MEKYVIVALVLLCVFLGAYAARLQRRLIKLKEECDKHKFEKQFLKVNQNQQDMIYGVMDMKFKDQTRNVTLLEQQLRIAEIRLNRIRNRLYSK